MKNNQSDNTKRSLSSTKRKEDKEFKLEYVLRILGLDNLITLFLSLKLTFIDFLLLSRQDIIQLNLELYQRNRILNFIKSYNMTVEKYSFDEIIAFFNRQRQFIFIQLHQPITRESVNSVIDKYCKDNNEIVDNPAVSTKEVKKIIKKEVENNINKENILKQAKVQQPKEPLQKDKHKNKQMIHSQTVDLSSRKLLRSTDNPFYQSYLKMNQESDNILNTLRQSREESESRHSKYSSLMNKNSHNITASNSGRYIPQEPLNKEEVQQPLELLENINNEIGDDVNKMNEDIKKLYEIINKKESLIKNLDQCNKSITEKKKILSFLIEDPNQQQDNNNEKNIKDAGFGGNDEENEENEKRLEEVDERNEEEDIC